MVLPTCGCTLTAEKDIWGDTTPVTAPCPKHARLVHHMQALRQRARSLQDSLACFSIWAQEVGNHNSPYDAQDLDDWRASLFKEMAGLRAALDAPDK